MGLLFFFLWAGPTIRWRMEFGSISFALVEPIVLGVVLLMLLSRKNSIFSIDASILALLLFFMWIVLVRPWSVDWKHGLSDVRDWLIPIIAFIVLLTTVKRGWRSAALAIIPLAVIQASLGVVQVITNSVRPFASAASLYKLDIFSINTPSFAVGFFEHPNSFAVFLIIAMIISIGWFVEQKSFRSMLLPAAVILLLTLTLYWTYAKAEILAVALMLFFYVAIRYIRSPGYFVTFSLFTILFILGAGWLAMNEWPVQFNTVWWRVDLWESVFQTLAQYPGILIWGNGETAFAANAIWPQPHNVFFDILIKYGLAGLLVLSLLMVAVMAIGTRAYNRGDLQRSGVLRALWVSIIGFSITGLVESSLLGVETRMLFLLLLACFIGLSREMAQVNSAPQAQPVKIDPVEGAA